MTDHILVAVAWPYANGPLHLGHIAGAYLPADIFARYNRIIGNKVLMVSGSDSHGTPITIRADAENTTPEKIFSRYHKDFQESWEGLNISWDLFTTTDTENHHEVTQRIFTNLLDNDFLYEAKADLPYSVKEKRYLPDRYIVGTCPNCDSENARGDQCEECGRTLDPQDLINPRSTTDGSIPEFRERSHFMFRLSKFEDTLKEWLEDKKFWRPNVLNQTTGLLEQGLKDRAITRDLSWGIQVPVDGWEDRRIYVWFEAVIGYLSASIEWAKEVAKDPDQWKNWWNEESKSYYFIGKDNIPFHTIIWPAMLLAYEEGLPLPHNVPSNEFLNLESGQFSTSRNWAVWVSDYLSRYEADPLRYVLSATMPETSDSEFTWRDFVRRNNNELVGTYGNLVHRTLTFLQNNFDGTVPEVELQKPSNDLIDDANKALLTSGQYLSECNFRASLKTAMDLCQQGNRYLDDREPWKAIKTDRNHAAETMFTMLHIISTLKILFYPFLPESSQKLHGYLGETGLVESNGWKSNPLIAGNKLPKPEPLFQKLDEEKVVSDETERMKKNA